MDDHLWHGLLFIILSAVVCLHLACSSPEPKEQPEINNMTSWDDFKVPAPDVQKEIEQVEADQNKAQSKSKKLSHKKKKHQKNKYKHHLSKDSNNLP